MKKMFSAFLMLCLRRFQRILVLLQLFLRCFRRPDLSDPRLRALQRGRLL